MKQRIAYIDAIRGFVIFFVVYSHVQLYTFGTFGHIQSAWTISNLFSDLLMPIFFFLSGFLMYRVNRFKDWSLCIDFLQRKGKELLIPTLFFSILFSLITTVPYKTLLLDRPKFGYWYTYTLFFYFVIYAIGDFVIGRRVKGKCKALIGLAVSVMIYAISKFSVVPSCPWFNSAISNIIGIPNFQFFIFFYFGVLFRAYLGIVEHFINQEKVVTTIILGFVLLQLILQLPFNKEWFFTNGLHPLYTLMQTFTGFWGIATVFIFFYKNAERIVNCHIGKSLQHIGIRTLDIYLVHTILVHTNMHFVGAFFTNHGSFVSELIVGSIVTMVIIVLCLLISDIIRCSDTLTKLLFGRVIK